MATKQSMLRDWGSWDADFNQITGRVRERLLAIAHASETHECVPLQGSGTFSVEAAIGTLVPRGGQSPGSAKRGVLSTHRPHLPRARPSRDNH